MPSRSSIPLFAEIAGYAEVLGLNPDVALPHLGVLRFGGSGALLRPPAPPHRRGFFLLAFGDRGRRTEVMAAAPEQLLEFSGGIFSGNGAVRTQLVLFTRELVEAPLRSPHNEFPYFHLGQPAAWTLPAEEAARVRRQIERLSVTAGKASPYLAARLGAALTTLLYDLRETHERQTRSRANPDLCRDLLCRFDDLVAERFATHHSVGEYARLLHVSPDHLSAEVKVHTGRNARDVIAARLLLEARHLLSHSSLTVAEIADRLHFSEPTHFTRFFRRHSRLTPREFRARRRPASPVEAANVA